MVYEINGPFFFGATGKLVESDGKNTEKTA